MSQETSGTAAPLQQTEPATTSAPATAQPATTSVGEVEAQFARYAAEAMEAGEDSDEAAEAEALEVFQALMRGETPAAKIQQPEAEPSIEKAPEGSNLPPTPPVPSQLDELLALQREQLEAQRAAQHLAVQREIEAQRRPPTDDELIEEIRRAGLDPTEPRDVFLWQSAQEQRKLQAQLAQQAQEYRQFVQQVQAQAQAQAAEQSARVALEAALSRYEVPAETQAHLARTAAAYVQRGYDPATVAQAALAPFLPLLKAKQAQAPSPPPAARRAVDQAALRAISTPGRSTGHGAPSFDLSKIPIDQLDRLLAAKPRH